MQINEEKHGAVMVLRPAGPISQDEAEQFRNRLDQMIQETLGRVVVDAAGVPFIDSAGLEVLADSAERLAKAGKGLKLCGCNPTLKEIFDLTDLAAQLEQFEEVNQAVRSFL